MVIRCFALSEVARKKEMAKASKCVVCVAMVIQKQCKSTSSRKSTNILTLAPSPIYRGG